MFSKKDFSIGGIGSKSLKDVSSAAGAMAKVPGPPAPFVPTPFPNIGNIGKHLGAGASSVLGGLSGIKLPNATPGGSTGAGAGGAAGAAAVGGGRRTIRQGSSGQDVARCQNLLNTKLAYSPPPLWVDGIFGPKTNRRTREFQGKAKLTVDGIVGPQTWAALDA